MEFSGWVPTVTGNLSFSTIGQGKFPRKCVRTDSTNAFLVYQKRDLLDVLIPYADDLAVARFFREKIANWVLKLSGEFTFVLVGSDNKENDSCIGTIFLVAHARNGKKLRLSKRAFQRSEMTERSLETFVKSISDLSCFEVNFELERQGKLKIQLGVQDEDVEAVSDILANQVFFFVKDISHVHQHHDPRHDAITEMTLNADSSDDDWVTKTQQALYRSIIRYKRFRNEKALFRASGILAYAQAFQKNYLVDDTKAHGMRSYHQAELEQSLKVSREEIKHFDQKRLAKIETFRNFFFALFGLAVSVTFIARLNGPLDVEVDQRLVGLAIELAKNPMQAVGLTFLASSIWMVVTHQRDPADSEFVRWVTRITQSFRLRYYILSNAIITALLSGASYYLLILTR